MLHLTNQDLNNNDSEKGFNQDRTWMMKNGKGFELKELQLKNLELNNDKQEKR